MTSDVTRLVNQRRRGFWTGSAEVLVHSLTNEELAALPNDPNILAYERNPDGHHTYSEGRVESAAKYELAWRVENGLEFGWRKR